jgi:hypothetical protein
VVQSVGHSSPTPTNATGVDDGGGDDDGGDDDDDIEVAGVAPGFEGSTCVVENALVILPPSHTHITP